MKHLIQFIDLNDLLDEGDPQDIYRIAALMQTDETGYDRTAYITVRQIQKDNVLSWSYMVGKTDYKQPGDTMPAQLDELAELTRQLEEEISVYISQEVSGSCRTGIIDIEDREIMFGVWSWWEEQNYNQDSEEE